MQRGQATLEYSGLALALLLGACLLVQAAGPVEGIARALLAELRPARAAPSPSPARPLSVRHRPSRPRRAPRCYCPPAEPSGGDGSSRTAAPP
jgi:hypothetical protein